MICLSATESEGPGLASGLFHFLDYTVSNTLLGHYPLKQLLAFTLLLSYITQSYVAT